MKSPLPPSGRLRVAYARKQGHGESYAMMGSAVLPTNAAASSTRTASLPGHCAPCHGWWSCRRGEPKRLICFVLRCLQPKDACS